MANLEEVVKINREDYTTLIKSHQVTISGTTYIYSNNTIYLVEDDGPHLYQHLTTYLLWTGSGYANYYFIHINTTPASYQLEKGSGVITNLNNRILTDIITYRALVDDYYNITSKYIITSKDTTTTGIRAITSPTTGNIRSTLISFSDSQNNRLDSDIVTQIN